MTVSPHIFIATPCFGGTVTQTYMQSILGCMSAATQHDLLLTLSMIGNDALITRTRNTFLHQFLTRSDATHLLFIDADIGFTLNDILSLLAENKPLIGAPYPLKSHYWDADTTRFQNAGESPQTASLRYVGDCPALYPEYSPQSITRPEVAQVAHIGTGFMLLTRQMALDMVAAHPETRYRRIDARRDVQISPQNSTDAHAIFDCIIDPQTGTYLSEDFTFCHRWRQIGGQVWLHRGVRLTHTGPTTFYGDMMLRNSAPAMFPS